MPQIISTNVASLNAQRNLNKSQTDLQVSLQRLSSGLRINSAKDDAAGLAISERFTAQIRGMNQAARNAADGISFSQTGEGALVEISNNLQRIRELAVQSANATNSSGDRVSLQKEVDQLTQEISRIVQSASFNGARLLDGTGGTLNFYVSADGSSASGTTISVAGVDLTSANTYAASLTATGTVDITTSGAAVTAIGNVDLDVDSVTSARATFGAVQNRFESVIANLQTSVENLSAARSRIRDADFAQETANLTRTQILQQAGTAMLAQANASSQNVLTLLR